MLATSQQQRQHTILPEEGAMSTNPMFMLRKLVLGGATVLLAAAVSAAAAQTTWKIGWTTPDAPEDPYALAVHYFTEELDKALPDKFNFQLYGNHQLGDETE